MTHATRIVDTTGATAGAAGARERVLAAWRAATASRSRSSEVGP